MTYFIDYCISKISLETLNCVYTCQTTAFIIRPKHLQHILQQGQSHTVSEHLHTRDPAMGTESLVKFEGSRTRLPLGESWRHPSSFSMTKISKTVYCCFPIVQCHYYFLHFYVFKPCYYIYVIVPSTRSMFLCSCCCAFVVVQFKYHVKRLELFTIRRYIKYPLLMSCN